MKASLLLAVIFAIAICLKTSAQIKASFPERIVHQFQGHFNNDKPDSVFSMLSPNTQRILSPSRLQSVFTQIRSQFGNLDSTRMLSSKDSMAYFKASFAKAPLLLTISLDVNQKIGIFTFTPYSEPARKSSNAHFEEVDISFTRPDLTLKGTLALPKSGIHETLIIIVAGSGPTDRNGNQNGAANNSLQMASAGLAEKGFATVRYDKRGVGESQKAGITEKDLRFDDYAKDLASITRDLMDDKRFKRIVLLGHSEGALLAMIVARELKPAGLIILNGQAEPADVLLRRQLRKNLPDSTFQIANTILAGLKAGKITDNISNTTLSGVFRPNVQPYLISWMVYDPTQIIKQVSVPTLIVQGLTDLQTGEDQAKKLAEALPSCKLVLIDDMNHVLKKSSINTIENLQTYNNPDLRLNEKLLPPIISFIDRIKQQP
ncbi:alpha/beta fold hydrolase [Dyadobacter chenwenxiniae]|uniref:alpha/beta fold hydrolase n=1 Tax=Dyadobacter chenwenxiniae TaxID=2906456 RepID=UPI0035B5BF29